MLSEVSQMGKKCHVTYSYAEYFLKKPKNEQTKTNKQKKIATTTIDTVNRLMSYQRRGCGRVGDLYGDGWKLDLWW